MRRAAEVWATEPEFVHQGLPADVRAALPSAGELQAVVDAGLEQGSQTAH